MYTSEENLLFRITKQQRLPSQLCWWPIRLNGRDTFLVCVAPFLPTSLGTPENLIRHVSRNSVLQSHLFLYGTEIYNLNTLADTGASFCWCLHQDENSTLGKLRISLICSDVHILKEKMGCDQELVAWLCFFLSKPPGK